MKLLGWVERFHRWQNRHLVEHRTNYDAGAVTTKPSDWAPANPCHVKGHNHKLNEEETKWICVRCGDTVDRVWVFKTAL